MAVETWKQVPINSQPSTLLYPPSLCLPWYDFYRVCMIWGLTFSYFTAAAILSNSVFLLAPRVPRLYVREMKYVLVR